jgi:hypothetical protein
MSCTRREIAEALKQASVSYFLKKRYSCFIELGLNSWGKLRGDVVAVNLKSHLVICECKSSKSDFILDGKWHKYMEYCHRMYFVTTEKVFDSCKATMLRKLKDKGIGVLILDPDSGYLKNVVPAKNRKIDSTIQQTLILRMAWRSGVSKRNSRRKRQFIGE